MKTLIVYASKYGTVKTCVDLLEKNLISMTDTIDIKNFNGVNINSYDNIIIGASVYMGKIQKEITDFCSTYKNDISNKKLGLFICCGFPENHKAHFENNFSEDFLSKASALECFGGLLDVTKLKGMDKFIAKMVMKATAKEGKGLPSVNTDNITHFAEIMNA